MAAGLAYDVGGFIRLVSAPDPTAQGRMHLFWSDNLDCSGPAPLAFALTPASSDTTWKEVAVAGVVAPAGAKAAGIIAALRIDVDGSFDAFWDDLYFEPTCSNSATTLCISGARFEVEASWHTPDGRSGAARAVPLSSESGYFWFFHPGNSELFVKVKNACGPPYNRIWFFAAGLTNVRVDIKVTDTKTGQTRTYVNPLNRAFQPIQDTEGFATCP